MQRVVEFQRVRVAPFFRDEAELRMILRKMMNDWRSPRNRHLRRVAVAENAIRVCRCRHHRAVMLDMTK